MIKWFWAWVDYALEGHTAWYLKKNNPELYESLYGKKKDA